MGIAMAAVSSELVTGSGADTNSDVAATFPSYTATGAFDSALDRAGQEAKNSAVAPKALAKGDHVATDRTDGQHETRADDRSFRVGGDGGEKRDRSKPDDHSPDRPSAKTSSKTVAGAPASTLHQEDVAKQRAFSSNSRRFYEDMTDELRQSAAQGRDPKSAVEGRLQIIRKRIAPGGKTAQEALEKIAKQVLAETPERRNVLMTRRQAAEAQSKFEALKPGGAGLPQARAAREQRDTSLAAFQNAATSDVGVEIAAQHLFSLRQQAMASPAAEKHLETELKLAEQQLRAVKDTGQVPLIFSDADKKTALSVLGTRYAEPELRQFFAAIGDALANNRITRLWPRQFRRNSRPASPNIISTERS
jgi:hypothetical protein